MSPTTTSLSSRLPSLPPRRPAAEVMDRPDLDPDLHRAALATLARINALSGAGDQLWRDIAPAVCSGSRVLDLACGGGDVSVALWRRAVRSGVELAVEGLDASPLAVAVAREHADALSAPVRFRVADVITDSLPDGADVVVCSLFLHHLSGEAAIDLLRRCNRAARRRVVIQDLRRCRLGTLLAATVPSLIGRSPVVRVDALCSARAAFTAGEIRGLARRAGLGTVRVRRHWPARMSMSWEPRS